MRFGLYSDSGSAPLKIDTIGFGRDQRITRAGPVQRSSYIIHYVLKGKGYYNGNPVSYGQGFLIFPEQLAEYHPDAEDPWEFLWIISFDDTMRMVFDRYEADPDSLIFSFCSDAFSVLDSVAETVIERHASILDPLELLEIFLHIFNRGIRKDLTLKSRSNSEVYLDFVRNYVETNMDQPISVLELENLLGVSQPYLYRIFQDRFHMSPKQYIINRKISHAKKLLLQTDMTVTQISNSVGYGDALAFSKLFARKERLSPLQYREAGK